MSTGAFSTVNAPFFDGHTLRVLYGLNQVTLHVGDANFLAADFTEDGNVNGNDLTRWRAGFGTGVTHMEGNADGDGDVDGAAFLAWQPQLSSPTSAGTNTSVPEPACSMLIVLTAAGLCARQNRAG